MSQPEQEHATIGRQTTTNALNDLPILVLEPENAEEDSENDDCEVSEKDDCDESGHESVTEMTVAATSNIGSRKWDKKYFCVYCHSAFHHLPRHLYQMHGEERDVCEIKAAKGKRKKIF
jgi:hypothetical protein